MLENFYFQSKVNNLLVLQLRFIFLIGKLIFVIYVKKKDQL